MTLPSMGVVSGYRREGWATTPNGAAVYAAGAAVQNLTTEPGGTVVLYAVWHQMGLYAIRPSAGEEPELVITETISYTYDTAGNRTSGHRLY